MAEVSHSLFILDREISVSAPGGVIGMLRWLAMFVGDRSEQVEIIEVTWGATVMHCPCELSRRLNVPNRRGRGGGRNGFLFDER